ncbi:hypothetical protein AAGG74_18745 [Bacillus mexicanus]|uniref:hypothetical protein n=1 Tax=Bacillus mexicanus TaxID=2834415 RepID=UPI003D1B346E
MKGKQMEQAIVSIANAIMDPSFRARKNYVRPPFVFWGPKGSGKTYTVNKAATALHIPAINVRLGQELAEDMSYPDIKEQENEKFLGKIIAEMFPRYKRDGEGNLISRKKVIDGEIIACENEYQINFSLIKNYIENWDAIEGYYTSQGLSVDDAPGGIVFLDEVNRIEDKQMFQMIFQLFDSGKFKGYVTPEEISFFAAANPKEKGYIVSDWFADPAFSNRCIHLKTTYDFETWLEFAEAEDSGYDELTIGYYKHFNNSLFDEEENSFEVPKNTSSFRNPAFLSLYGVGIEYPDPAIRNDIISAIIGPKHLSNFLQVEDKIAEKILSPEEILSQYDEFELGEEPVIEKIEGKRLDGTPITTYEIGTLKEAYEHQESKGNLRKNFLNAVQENKSSWYNETCDQLVKYIIKNAQDEDFRKHLSDNLLRLARFLFDLPKGKCVVAMKELVDSDEDTNIIPLLTQGINGRYFSALFKYSHETIKEYLHEAI